MTIHLPLGALPVRLCSYPGHGRCVRMGRLPWPSLCGIPEIGHRCVEVIGSGRAFTFRIYGAGVMRGPAMNAVTLIAVALVVAGTTKAAGRDAYASAEDPPSVARS
jgi:hypothetical protein